MKLGYNYIIIGGTGQGKSYLTKIMLEKLPKKTKINIWDVNEEYEGNNYKPPCILGEEDKFLDFIHGMKFCVNVFEEATYFLGHGKNDKRVLNAISRKRHLNLLNIFLFTSLGTVPVDILRVVDKIFMLNTADTEHNVRKFKGNHQVWAAYKASRSAGKLQYSIAEPNKF